MKNKTKILAFLLSSSVGLPVYAQTAASGGDDTESMLVGLTILFVTIMFVSLIGIALIFSTILKHKETLEAEKTGKQMPPQGLFDYIWSKLNSFDKEQTLENTKKEDLHSYDDIVELDNSLPPWWLALFYITIILSVFYLGYYHVMGGPSSSEEYDMEVASADIKLKAYLDSQPASVSEDTVEEYNSPALIANGKAVYDKNCVVCHGPQGQGSVGPNLTDDYWLHGNDIKDIFKIIKYGKIEKGMLAWEKKLTPEEIANTSNFILSIVGTNPPNPKEPQGKKY